MIKINNLFEKKILYTNLIGLPIITLLLLSGKFYYKDSLGDIKFYTDYVGYFCGFISFWFFMNDNKFKLKYWIFMIISNLIISFFSSLLISFLVLYKFINIQTSIFLIYIIINILIFPILYKTFKDYSYQECLNKGEI